MTTLQDDLLEIYNSLVLFNDDVLNTDRPIPITVWYEKDSRLLAFENRGKSVRLPLAHYYTLALEDLDGNPSYLLPSDYDKLMYNLRKLIISGELIKERTCLSPENYGFDIYAVNPKEAWKGPDLVGSVRFVSGTGRIFKWITKIKYKLS
jgi:hypothetical protein